ncbi:MAG: polyamine aminopropyltransferase [Anaerolineae bacterium]
MNPAAGVSPRERTTLLVAVLIISICALTYELIVATLSSYLLGSSVTQFSLTIGFFLFAMGLGSLLSRQIKRHELRWFILVELAIGFFGGTSAVVLYAVFASATVYYTLTMIALSLVIGICIGLEIPLLTRIVALDGAVSHALADVLSVDYIGALLASLAFPLLLLPLLGVTQTAFLMGLFNIGVAAVLLLTFWQKLPVRWVRFLGVGCGAVSLLMLSGSALSMNVVRYFEQQLYEDRILYREQTLYQLLIMTRKGEDVRLFIDGNLQFSSRDEYRYHEMLVHPVMSIPRSHERILVLGGGDGLVARELLKYDTVEEIIVVDLDPEMTELARNHPLMRQINESALDDPRVTVINADAFNYIGEGSDLFNAIIIDLPDPNNEGLSKLYSQQFYTMLQSRLTPDGAFITQATSPYFVREAFWMIASTIQASGFDTLPLRTYVPSFGEWGFVIGAPHTLPEVTFDEGITRRYLTTDVLADALTFDPDTDFVETEINTLDHPVLPGVYEAGWREWN